MLKSNRLRNATLGGLAAIVAILCVLAIVDLSTRQQAGADRIQRESAEDTKQRQYAVANCTADAPIKTIICTLNAQATEREQRRSHDDLEAQQESARAAFWAIVLAGVQALVAIGGFAIVFRSLDLSRAGVKAAIDANDHARESSERQLRAYLTLEKYTITRYEIGKPLAVTIHIRNSGQTPARGVQICCGMMRDLTVRPRRFRFKIDYLSKSDIGAGADALPVIELNEDVTQEHVRGIVDGSQMVEVGGIARYLDVFGRPHRLVFRGFLVTLSDGSAGFINSPKNNRAD